MPIAFHLPCGSVRGPRLPRPAFPFPPPPGLSFLRPASPASSHARFLVHASRPCPSLALHAPHFLPISLSSLRRFFFFFSSWRFLLWHVAPSRDTMDRVGVRIPACHEHMRVVCGPVSPICSRVPRSRVSKRRLFENFLLFALSLLTPLGLQGAWKVLIVNVASLQNGCSINSLQNVRRVALRGRRKKKKKSERKKKARARAPACGSVMADECASIGVPLETVQCGAMVPGGIAGEDLHQRCRVLVERHLSDIGARGARRNERMRCLSQPLQGRLAFGEWSPVIVCFILTTDLLLLNNRASLPTHTTVTFGSLRFP